jgi:hypothetical protein
MKGRAAWTLPFLFRLSHHPNGCGVVRNFIFGRLLTGNIHASFAYSKHLVYIL